MTYYDITDGSEISDDDMEARYVETLDEVYEPFAMGEITFQPSDILKSCDPIAFRVYLGDYISSEIDETIVESGYWVRVLTEDGEIERDPEWFTDEDEARDAFDALVGSLSDARPDADGVSTVQMYDTSDAMLAEERVGE